MKRHGKLSDTCHVTFRTAAPRLDFGMGIIPDRLWCNGNTIPYPIWFLCRDDFYPTSGSGALDRTSSEAFETNLFEPNLFEPNMFEPNLFEPNLFETNLFETNLCIF